MYSVRDNINTIYKNYATAMVFFATRIVHDKDLAQEIVGNVWLKLLESNKKFKSEENVKAFMYVCVKNASYDSLKLGKSRSARDALFFELNENTERDILYEMINTELLRLLVGEIEKLTGKYKIVCKHIFLDGLSNQETAILLKMPVSTVKNIKFIAINNLKYAFLNYKHS